MAAPAEGPVGWSRAIVVDVDDPAGLAAPVGRMRLRPDLEVEHMEVAQAQIEALGARLVAIVHERTDETHRRMADEGNGVHDPRFPPPDLAEQVYDAD